MKTVDILFDGPPGPVAGRFVKVEDTETRKSVSFGEWVERDDGYWVLRIPVSVSQWLEGLKASPSQYWIKHWVEDCMKWHGRVLYGKNRHWCPDWDDLPIDETCDESDCCLCTFKDLRTKQ